MQKVDAVAPQAGPPEMLLEGTWQTHCTLAVATQPFGDGRSSCHGKQRKRQERKRANKCADGCQCEPFQCGRSQERKWLSFYMGLCQGCSDSPAKPVGEWRACEPLGRAFPRVGKNKTLGGAQGKLDRGNSNQAPSPS